MAVGVFFSPMVFGWSDGCPSGRAGVQAGGGKEFVRVGTLVRGCSCTMSWSDLDLTFDLAVVTLSLKILSGLYLGNCKV